MQYVGNNISGLVRFCQRKFIVWSAEHQTINTKHKTLGSDKHEIRNAKKITRYKIQNTSYNRNTRNNTIKNCPSISEESTRMQYEILFWIPGVAMGNGENGIFSYHRQFAKAAFAIDWAARGSACPIQLSGSPVARPSPLVFTFELLLFSFQFSTFG